MDIYLLQMAIIRGKPGLNRAKVLALTGNLKPGKFSLVVLPELFSTGFLDEGALQPQVNEKSAVNWNTLAIEDKNFFSTIAQNLNCFVLGATAEKGEMDGEGNVRFRNLSLLFGPDGNEKFQYQKIHPFSYGGEDRVFSRGNTVVTYQIEGKSDTTNENWIIQPSICYDLRFPELFRAGSSQGSQLIVVQANWPAARQAHWEALLKARAIENQAFVVGVNCTQNQDKLQFIGGSMIVSPKGEVIAACKNEERVLHTKLDIHQCLQWRKTFPALADRLPWSFFSA